MSSAVRGAPRLPVSLCLEEELMGGDRQGIGTILGFSFSVGRQGTEARKSLRRTFSADMSSKKWLAQHMPSALKKTTSSREFSQMSVTDSSSASSASASEGEEEKEERRKEVENPGQLDIWSMIQSQKPADSNSTLPPPYIHPLVKRSSSSLSQKSLQICTESLGSETGSDSFSSPESPEYTTSDSSDEEVEEEALPIAVEKELKTKNKESGAVNYRRSMSRKTPPCPFPPPLPSFSRQDGPRIRMRHHRKDGRLVLEAISISSQNNFHAERQDGRLVLSLVKKPSIENNHKTTKEEEEEKKAQQAEVVEEVDEVAINKEIVLEVKIVQEDVAAAVMKVHRPTLMMSKIVTGVVQLNRPPNVPWMKNPAVEEKDASSTRATRIMPKPTTAAAASFNGYDHVMFNHHHHHHHPMPSKLVLTQKKPVMVVKPEEFLPMMMRCMEFSRPVLVWEPRCIATT